MRHRFWIWMVGLTALLAPVLPAAGQAAAHSQEVAFTSSNLPIVLLYTDGVEIPDEPKIGGRMRIVYNGEGRRNEVTGPFNEYDGPIGIERRGASSQSYPKKSYAVETRNADGTNRNVSLLGMPKENDWVLYAPYSDKALLRDVLAYRLANRMGRYAPRTRFCELVLNGHYEGVYVLMEKPKADKGRVAIASLSETDVAGDSLTGGYIVKIDRAAWGQGWTSPYKPFSNTHHQVFYQYHDPKASDLRPEQAEYIRRHITAFETMMKGADWADPQRGYPAWIDVGSFVDFFLVNEVSRNVDGYRLSTFLYKDRDSRDPRLHMGPVWDFNFGFGNADYYDGWFITGLQVDFAVLTDDFQNPFWWPRLMRDAAFTDSIEHRWQDLRRNVLHADTIDAFIDVQAAYLGEAQQRNFQRWPILNQYVWANKYIWGSYAGEVGYLKRWTRQRLAWLDTRYGYATAADDAPALPDAAQTVEAPHPNPASAWTEVNVAVRAAQPVEVALYDVAGRRVVQVPPEHLAPGERRAFRIDLRGLAAGVYYARVSGPGWSRVVPVVVAR